MSLWPILRQTLTAPCTVEIDSAIDIQPGDEVLVHDAPTDVPYGERIVVQRTATIIRAGLLERAWTRIAGNFELTELYDVSFTERRKL